MTDQSETAATVPMIEPTGALTHQHVAMPDVQASVEETDPPRFWFRFEGHPPDCHSHPDQDIFLPRTDAGRFILGQTRAVTADDAAYLRSLVRKDKNGKVLHRSFTELDGPHEEAQPVQREHLAHSRTAANNP